MCEVMRYKRFIVGQNTKIQVMQQITIFFTIFCSVFIAITSVESCPGEWIQVQSLVLSEGDQYNIDYLNFDINQSYLVNKDIIEDMEHDPRILTPSLAVLSHGAWSHRPDDKYLHDENTVLKRTLI